MGKKNRKNKKRWKMDKSKTSGSEWESNSTSGKEKTSDEDSFISSEKNDPTRWIENTEKKYDPTGNDDTKSKSLLLPVNLGLFPAGESDAEYIEEIHSWTTEGDKKTTSGYDKKNSSGEVEIDPEA